MSTNLAGVDFGVSFGQSYAEDPFAPYTNTGGANAAATLTLDPESGVTVTEESDAIQETTEAISLTVDGPGTIDLTGPNTYSGGTTLQAEAVLEIGDSGALGSGGLTFAGAASLIATATATLSNAVSNDPGVSASIGAAEGQALTLDGDFIAHGGSGATVHFGSTSDTGVVYLAPAIADTVGGSGGAIAIDGGTLVLANSGSAFIIDNLQGGLTVGAGAVVATLDLDGENVTATNLFGDAEGAITNNGDGTAMLQTANSASSSFAGIIENGSGQTALHVSGSEGTTFTLTGSNSYTGGTTIDFGLTLQIGDGGTSGQITGSVTDNGTLAFDLSDAVTFSGAIGGNGGVRILGGGGVTLNGANSFSGGVLLSAGVLDLANGEAAGTGAITFSGPSAELVIEQGDIPTDAIGGLAVGDSLDLAGVTATAATLNGSNELVLTRKGATEATLQLAGANSGLHFSTLAGAAGTQVFVAASLAQYATDKASLDATPGGFAIVDTASDIREKLGVLDSDSNLKVITATGGKVIASKATFPVYKAALNKIVGGFEFSDTVANVTAELAKLEADVSRISSVHFTNSGTPALAVKAAQATADAKVIRKIAAPYVLDVHNTSGSWTTTGHGNKLVIHDMIDLARSEFHTLTDLKNDAKKSGSNVVITGTGSDRLTLNDMTLAAFDKALGDFELTA